MSNETAGEVQPNPANPWNPENEDYIRDVVEEGIAVYVVGVVVLFGFLLFFLYRFCCCACRHKHCCPHRDDTASKGPRTAARAIAAVLLVALAAASVWLASAGGPLGGTFEDLTDNIVAQIDLLSADVNSTIDNVRAAVPEGETLESLGIDTAPLDDGLAALADAREKAQGIDDDISSTMWVLVGLFIAVGVIGFVAAVSGCGFVLCPVMLALVFVFFLTAMLASFGGFAIGSTALIARTAFDDACGMMRLHVAGEQNAWVLSKLPCDELAQINGGVDTVLKSISAGVADGNAQIQELNQVAGAIPIPGVGPEQLPLLCEPYVQANNGSYVPNTDTGPNCVPVQLADVRAAYNESVCNGYNATEGTELTSDPGYQRCFIAGDPIPANVYAEILVLVGDLEELEAALPSIRNIARCGFIDTAFQNIIDEDCGPLKDDLTSALAASLLTAILATLAGIFFCFCTQNVRRQKAVDEDKSTEAYPVADPLGQPAYK